MTERLLESWFDCPGNQTKEPRAPRVASTNLNMQQVDQRLSLGSRSAVVRCRLPDTRYPIPPDIPDPYTGFASIGTGTPTTPIPTWLCQHRDSTGFANARYLRFLLICRHVENENYRLEWCIDDAFTCLPNFHLVDQVEWCSRLIWMDLHLI